MSLKLNLWSLTLLPGEKYPLYVRRDFQITNAALGEELRSATGRSVVKVFYQPVPPQLFDSDSEDEDSDLSGMEDEFELDSDEEGNVEADGDDEDMEAEPKKAKANGGKVNGASAAEVVEEDDDDEDEDDDYSDDDVPEETVVLCSLTGGRIEQSSLNLTFVEGDAVMFEVTGENVVHLAGNYIHQFTPDEDDSDIDSDEQDDYADLYGDEDEEELDIEEIAARAGKITAIDDTPALKKAVAAASGAGSKPKAKSDPKPDVKAPAKIASFDSQPAAALKTAVDAKSAAQKRKAEEIESPMSKPAAGGVAADTLSKSQKKKLAKKAKTENGGEGEAKPAAAVKKDGKPAGIPPKRTLPSGLIIEDVKVGDGPVAKTGKRLGMRYVGKLTTGKQFDANTAGKPFSFVLGRGEVIRGWDEGLAGMAVGGERRLTIPPALAYGNQKIPDIPRNSTLTFDVKLVTVA